MVACCHSREQAEHVKAQLARWLAPRGLVFNEVKTNIVHLEEGFDFLGFNVRRYRHGRRPGKLLIKPSPEAVERIRKRLAEEMRRLRGSNARAVIARMNPIIRGWSAYYRGAVSSKVFSSLDHYMWQLTAGWARRTHPKKPKKWIARRYWGRVNKFRNDHMGRLTAGWARRPHPKKPKKWIARRYWGRFNKFRNDQWVFGDPDRSLGDRRENIACLVKFAWPPIVRHTLATGRASPDARALTRYWVERRRKVKPALDSYNLRLLAKQDGRCPLCGDHVLTADQPPQSPSGWERWWLNPVDFG